MKPWAGRIVLAGMLVATACLLIWQGFKPQRRQSAKTNNRVAPLPTHAATPTQRRA